MSNARAADTTSARAVSITLGAPIMVAVDAIAWVSEFMRLTAMQLQHATLRSMTDTATGKCIPVAPFLTDTNALGACGRLPGAALFDSIPTPPMVRIRVDCQTPVRGKNPKGNSA
jgi:hypothetical protein